MFIIIMCGILLVGCLYGYVRNILKIFTTLNEPQGNATDLFVLVRLIGVFIPFLGIVLGFF